MWVGALLACRSVPAPTSRESTTVTPTTASEDRAVAPIDRVSTPADDGTATPQPEAGTDAPSDATLAPIDSELATPATEAAPAPSPSDDEIRTGIVETSIAEYEGNCPCPYHTMSNGRRCGARSAYTRGGGDAPLCYAHDVTADMIEQHRARPLDP